MKDFLIAVFLMITIFVIVFCFQFLSMQQCINSGGELVMNGWMYKECLVND